MPYLKSPINYNMIGDGTGSILLVNVSFRVGDHRMSQLMLGQP